MKVFVTGGTGFVGANLVRSLLDKGYEVRALVRGASDRANLQGLDVEVVTGDLNDPDLVPSLRGCQALFHAAAHYSLLQKERDRLFQINILGTRNILRAAREAGVERVVYTSSVAAIGVPSDGSLADETYQSSPDRLIGAYKQSKYWAEQEARKAMDLGQDIVIVSPSSPIGPYDIKPTPTGDLVLRFLQGRMPAYVDTGLNFVDVRDVAQGHILALEKGVGGDRYILGNENLSLKSVLAMLGTITSRKPPQCQLPLWLPLGIAWVDEKILGSLGKTPSVPIDGVRMSRQKMFYNPSKAVKTLGLPQTEVAIALADAVDWFKRNGYVQ
ncbi:MAG: NAD-dependent epimerase/dehydratase family protein [Alkalinema sp. RU_4_3]|nr:NAD-dependent epimerase/dehydratase family protein [Alkalinema sp. RU_4_3]